MPIFQCCLKEEKIFGEPRSCSGFPEILRTMNSIKWIDEKAYGVIFVSVFDKTVDFLVVSRCRNETKHGVRLLNIEFLLIWKIPYMDMDQGKQ